jgi:transposase
MLQDNVLLVDNAAIHKTDGSLVAINLISDDKYIFSPKYSPNFKPIELGFANVKNWIRRSTLEAALEAINRAMRVYSTCGERSFAAYGHWKEYFENYSQWLEATNS